MPATLDISDFDNEDLACAGLRRVKAPDWFDGLVDILARMDSESLKIARDEAPPPPIPAPRRRQRKASVRALIAQAEKSGKAVTSVTTPDGTTLHFGQPEPSNELDEWLKKKNAH